MAEAIVPVKRPRTWLFVLGGLVLLVVIAAMAALLALCLAWLELLRLVMARLTARTVSAR